MMKIALLLHGHLRSFKKTYPSLEYFVGFNNFDIFIHTWDNVERETESYYESNLKENYKVDEQEIINLYKPKKILIEEQIVNQDLLNSNFKWQFDGLKFFFESFYKANKLKKQFEEENNFTYDVVIKFRPDIYLRKSFDVTNLNMELCNVCGNKIKEINEDKNNIVYLENNINYLLNFKALDCFLITNSIIMDKIAEFYEEYENFKPKIIYNIPFITYILQKNIKIKILDYYYNNDWALLRIS